MSLCLDSSSDELEGDGEGSLTHSGEGTANAPPPAPPPVPPRTESMTDLVEGAIAESPEEASLLLQQGKRPVLDQFPTHEEVTIDSDKQSMYISSKSVSEREKEKVLERKLRNSHTDMQEMPSPQTERKRIAPPKPPRTDLIESGELKEKEEVGGADRADEGKERGGVKEEIKRVVRRVSSIVDMNDRDLTRVARSTTPVRHGPGMDDSNKLHPPVPTPVPRTGSPIPKPRLIRRRSKSSDGILRPSITKAYSNDPRMMRHAGIKRQPRAKVSHLIQMFEGKPPEPQTGRVTNFKWTPPSPRRRSNALSEVSSGESTEPSPTHSRPYLPPKPQHSAPPVPPKPLPCTGEGPPILPPRTPAPLVPPKPPGSKAPKILPRMVPRQRSHSDSDSKILDETLPPRVPPK